MIWIATFFAAQALASLLAVRWGGMPERLIAAALTVAMLIGIAIPYSPDSYHGVFWAIFAIDCALFFVVLSIALFADRFWALWLSGALLLTIAMHGVRAYDQHVLPYAYWLVTGKSGYLMLALLVAGAWRHRERRKSAAAEFDWSAHRRLETGRAT